MGPRAQVLLAHAEVEEPLEASLDPILVPLLVLARLHEVLHLHLLELAGAEDEVAWRDLVAERLADLRDAEGHLAAGRHDDVVEVDEDALGRLGAQPNLVGLVLNRACVGFEHEVEHARLRQRRAVFRALQSACGEGCGLLRVFGHRFLDVVGAESLMAFGALDERVGEAISVSAGDPHLRRLDDR